MSKPDEYVVYVDGVEHPFQRRGEAREFKARMKIERPTSEIFLRARFSGSNGDDVQDVADGIAQEQ